MARPRKQEIDIDVRPAADCTTKGTSRTGWCARPEGAPKPGGKRDQRHRHFKDLDQANEFGRDVRRTREVQQQVGLPPGYTIGDAIDDYLLPYKSQNPRTWRAYTNWLQPPKDKFGHWPRSALRESDVIELRDAQLEHWVVDGVNQMVRHLDNALERLRNLGQAYNAAAMVKSLKKERPRLTLAQMRSSVDSGAYSPEEIARILVAADDIENTKTPGMRPMFWMWMLNLRRGEALGAEWENVLLERDEVGNEPGLLVNQQWVHNPVTGLHELAKVKSAAGDRLLRLPPLVTTMLGEVREWQIEQHANGRFPQLPTRVVVKSKGNKAGPAGSTISSTSVYPPWYALLDRAGVRHLKPHACRATIITQMKKRGVDEYAVKAWAGHSARGDVTEEHYTHLQLVRWAEAAEAWQAIISDILSEFGAKRDKSRKANHALHLVGA
ncbi:tyrosine-type recombinase/integrase [Nocardia tengchongensis]